MSVIYFLLSLDMVLSHNIITTKNKIYTYYSLSNSTEKFDDNITQEDALHSIYKLVGPLQTGYYINYNHLETLNDKKYYVFQYYEVVLDNTETGEGHTVTYDWFYVDKRTGEIYRLDIIKNVLIKIIDKNKK